VSPINVSKNSIQLYDLNHPYLLVSIMVNDRVLPSELRYVNVLGQIGYPIVPISNLFNYNRKLYLILRTVIFNLFFIDTLQNFNL